MKLSPTVKGLLSYIGIALPLCVLLFLFLCDFFTAFDGHAVSKLPAEGEEAQVARVLIVDESSSSFQRDWPVELVNQMELPVDVEAQVPSPLPDGLPVVRKSRYTLNFRVIKSNGTTGVIPTTSPGILGVILLVAIVGLFLRNMLVAKSPLLIERRAAKPLKPLAPSGQPHQRRRSKKGPPPKPGKRSRRRR